MTPDSKTEMVTLAPCPNPWCEADEREGDFRPQVQYSNFALVYVACTSCGMAGPTRQHEAEAIAQRPAMVDEALRLFRARIDSLLGDKEQTA